MRGYDSLEKIKVAIDPGIKLFHSPWLLYDMARAVERIHQAVSDHESIWSMVIMIQMELLVSP